MNFLIGMYYFNQLIAILNKPNVGSLTSQAEIRDLFGQLEQSQDLFPDWKESIRLRMDHLIRLGDIRVLVAFVYNYIGRMDGCLITEGRRWNTGGLYITNEKTRYLFSRLDETALVYIDRFQERKPKSLYPPPRFLQTVPLGEYLSLDVRQIRTIECLIAESLKLFDIDVTNAIHARKGPSITHPPIAWMRNFTSPEKQELFSFIVNARLQELWLFKLDVILDKQTLIRHGTGILPLTCQEDVNYHRDGIYSSLGLLREE